MIQLRNALDIFTLIMLVMTILLLIYTVSVMLMQRNKSKTASTPKVITKVKCVHNDYSLEREFSKGDYVGLEVGKCPKCGGVLTIDAIYAVGGIKEREPAI
ncbi:MAG: hypothetical protein QXH57_01220 [Sulfolobales archaeon]